MEFRIAGKEVHVRGRVTGDELATFKDVAATHPAVDTVVFDGSPGGDVWTALRVGALIRDSSWSTVVAGPCYSACTLMYLGGKNRHFARGVAPRSMFLAFHGTYSAAFLDRGAPAFRGRVEVRDWVVARTGGNLDPELIERFMGAERTAEFLYVFDPQQLRNADGSSVFFCNGREPKGTKPFEGCAKLSRGNAFTMGIVTRSERLDIAPRMSLPAPFKPTSPPAPWQ